MSPYDILGVRPGATDEQIAKAYKALAKIHHPDLNPGDATAARKMGEINQAYDQIRSMRQSASSASEQQVRPHVHYHVRPGIGPVGMLLAVLVTFLLVRFVLSLLFGGFGGYYYVNPVYTNVPESHYGYFMPGSSAYRNIP